jgi:hypothetical protein
MNRVEKWLEHHRVALTKASNSLNETAARGAHENFKFWFDFVWCETRQQYIFECIHYSSKVGLPYRQCKVIRKYFPSFRMTKDNGVYFSDKETLVLRMILGY